MKEVAGWHRWLDCDRSAALRRLRRTPRRADFSPTPRFPSKKLTCSDRATNSSFWRCHKHGSGGERLDLHSVAEVGQAFDQTCFLLVRGTAIEVIVAEVLVRRAVLEHVVDSGEDGGGDGHDGLLGAAPGFDAVVLGLQVAVFLFYRRPGALHQRGLEPVSPLCAGDWIDACRHSRRCADICRPTR